MRPSTPSIDSIFFSALEKTSPEERANYLDQVCGDDRDLRQRVERLLDAHPKAAGSFLESPPSALAETEQETIAERTGATIGPYKLLQRLGEGGMGTVFMAEQHHPVKRRVAVKIIRHGMDSRQFIARFEAERQALAMMDHPNIAKVLDAGCTETGRPYFVMELVKGVPITQFCDENRLTARQRLELFVSVCQGVQHAHQKGIIHRDLKPSNVLVAMYDDRPVPKIIDFGVAKATNQQLTDKTLFTQVGQIVGTWEYMSPEQAVLNQLDVDTRTDVYSLGVILYELLTGVTPLESSRLRSAALEETLRLIREEEPLRPSNRISSLGESATATAGYRRTSAISLARSLRGDMDWVVMKALEKDRTRRYETAAALAADLTRHLNEEAVEARPPSTIYRLRKIALRHRVALAATAAVMVALVAGIVSSAVLAVQMYEQKETAVAAQARLQEALDSRQQILDSLQHELIDRAFTFALAGDVTETENAIKRARTADAPEDVLRTIQGIAYRSSGDYKTAMGILEDVLEDYPDSLAALCTIRLASVGTNFERWNSYHERIIHAAKGENISDHARLLLAETKVFATTDIPGLIRDLDAIIGRHPRWGAAYSVRALAKVELGQMTMSMETLQDALADAEKARRLLPDNPYALIANLHACNYILTLAIHEGIDTTEIVKRAKGIADELELWPNHLVGGYMRLVHYQLTGQDDKLEAVRKQLRGLGYGSPQPELAEALLDDDRSKLLALVDKYPSQATPKIALAIRHVLDGDTDSAFAILEQLEQGDACTNTRCLMLDIPSIAGRPDIAKRSAQRILDRLPASDAPSVWRFEPWQAMYVVGDLPKEELIRRAGPFLLEASGVHWCIGMHELANGNIEKAREHLEIGARLKDPGCWGTCFSTIYLSLIDEGRIPVASENRDGAIEGQK